MTDDYTLIGLNKVPKVIGVSTKYMKDVNDCFLDHSKIEYIDLLTSKYDKRMMKQALAKNASLDNDRIEIFIYHQHKFDGKIKLKYFPVLFKEDTTEEFKQLIEKKNKNKPLVVEDIMSLISVFFGKYFHDNTFRDIADFYYTDLDIHVLRDYKIIYSNLADSKKRQYTKYKPISYNDARKLMVIIDIYKKYGNLHRYLEHMNEINRYNVKFKNTLDRWTNKNIVTGQMELFEDANTLNNNPNNEKPKVRKVYPQTVEGYAEELNQIKSEPWDNHQLKEALEKNTFAINDIEKMTLEDQVRAGFIDIVDYHYLQDEERKKHR